MLIDFFKLKLVRYMYKIILTKLFACTSKIHKPNCTNKLHFLSENLTKVARN